MGVWVSARRSILPNPAFHTPGADTKRFYSVLDKNKVVFSGFFIHSSPLEARRHQGTRNTHSQSVLTSRLLQLLPKSQHFFIKHDHVWLKPL
ncbi:hypothetical protein HanPSC8_Chr01g0006201 [Helianthus annuus]|nr:hypothetical protein HanPSC8_Chr01g0006171 [Helianthus annuus]KAJ0955727.1 hypothetical protein HanPSC8_Chr01g0006201 [Helianthus annuus]